MKTRIIVCFMVACVCLGALGKKKVVNQDLWPDGTEIPAWFSDTSRVDVSGLKRYVVTDYGVDGYGDAVQTDRLQAVIDRCVNIA